jgi:hypothetical protein
MDLQNNTSVSPLDNSIQTIIPISRGKHDVKFVKLILKTFLMNFIIFVKLILGKSIDLYKRDKIQII